MEMRHQNQNEQIENLLKENVISPRTYDLKKKDLEKWLEIEKIDLQKASKDIEKGWVKALDSIKKCQREQQ